MTFNFLGGVSAGERIASTSVSSASSSSSVSDIIGASGVSSYLLEATEVILQYWFLRPDFFLVQLPLAACCTHR